jgi:uncharacterized protein YcfJ
MQSRLIGICALVSLVWLARPTTVAAQTVRRSSSVLADNAPPADTTLQSFGRRQRASIAPFAIDSARPRSRRGAIAGGVLGAIVGGVAAAGYVLNATAYDCTTVGPPCPNDPHTMRRVTTIALGTASGAFLGAWLGHHIDATRAR